MDYQPMPSARKLSEVLQKGPKLGSTTTDGQSITPNPPDVTIHNRAQATRIKSELREASRSTTYGEWMARIRTKDGEILAEMPSRDLPCLIDRLKIYPEGHWVSEFRAETSAAKDSQLSTFHRAPAHRETVLAHLQRLSMHRHLKGDQTQQSFLLADYTRRLCAHHATELQVFDAVEHFIEQDEKDFFPSYASIHKRVFGKPESDKHGKG